MEKDLVNIISDKSYLELSEKEREEIKEYVTNEDEYNQMREVFLMMETIDVPEIQPKVETKQNLDALFDESYPKVSPVWYMSVFAAVVPKEKPFIQQPLLKVAALVVLILLIYPFLQSDQLGVNNKEQLAQTEISSDEIFENEGLPEKAQESKEQNNEQSDKANDVLVEDDEFGLILQPTEELRAMESPARISEMSLSSEMLADPTSAGSAGFSSVAETGFDHPDGIFDESINVPSKSVSADRNPAVLDLLTATF